MQALEIGPAAAALATHITPRAAKPAQTTVFVIALPLACGQGVPCHWSIVATDYAQFGNKIQACQGLASVSS
jgi:hypothetical protein